MKKYRKTPIKFKVLFLPKFLGMALEMDKHSCLAGLSSEEWKLFEDRKTQVTYLKGETLIKQGALATNVFYINEGLVKKYMQSGSQKTVNLRLVKQGDFMAFFTVFGPKIYPYSAVALTDTTVCMIDKKALTDVMLGNPEFALEMTRRNFVREHRYLEVINSLSFKQMRGKLASALLYLSSDHFADVDVFEYLTRQDIADFASVTIESAIKFVKEFEKEGFLKLEGKKIVIVKRDELEEVSRVG